MFKHEVRTPEQALAYLTDCTLATVCNMALKKSRPKGEYVRQKLIAQTAVNWMICMKVDCRGTRAEDVIEAGDVDAWAAQFEPRTPSPGAAGGSRE